MQTIYYETNNFIRHEGNLVDLGAYRQKLAAVSGGGWDMAARAPAVYEVEQAPSPAPVLALVPPVSEAQVRSRHRRRRVRGFALALDACATLAIVVLTVCAVVVFLSL